ncbi:MAG: glycoside hydrolase family 88 protein [Myxococcales bacterium]|nr:MAG: glycoside hydrolase family 88 protein [Myxococcales bacterium]
MRLLVFTIVTVLAGCGEAATPSPGAPAPGGGEGGVAVLGGRGGATANPQAGQGGMHSAGGPGAGAGGTTAAAGGGAGSHAGAPSGGVAAGGGGAGGSGGSTAGGASHPYPSTSSVLSVLERVNEQFAEKWPDPATRLPGSRPSNIWTRCVYFEGLLALQEVSPRAEHLEYALDWASYHDWSFRAPGTNADNQCAGQVYFDLFELDQKRDPKRVAALRQSLNAMLNEPSSANWTWIDAIQMSMPSWAREGVSSGDAKYLEKMHALYRHTKRVEGGGLYDEASHLWWRDAQWKPGRALTPSGKNVFWSRGNGWVLAALVRVLDRLPEGAAHRPEYEQDFRDMAEALRLVQREDGLWNASLADPAHYGGPEVSGTALFTYGMAWGIRRGLLSEEVYGPVVREAWAGLERAVRADGFLGFVQSTGDDPSDGQPLSADKQPDFEDYGVGCFLLAGSELSKLTRAQR